MGSSRIYREASAVGGSAGDVDRRQHAAITVVEEADGGKVLSPNAWSDIGQRNVIGRVVGNEFVHQ